MEEGDGSMPYVSVPKDLTRVKTKVALNLTKRQLICFSAAGAVGIPTYLLTRPSLGNDISMLLMIGLMLPFFMAAMYEKDGQPFEKAAYHFIRARFLWPGPRPYGTENIYAALMRQNRLEEEAKRFVSEKEKAKIFERPDAKKRRAFFMGNRKS
jgi:hypothetical protein